MPLNYVLYYNNKKRILKIFETFKNFKLSNFHNIITELQLLSFLLTSKLHKLPLKSKNRYGVRFERSQIHDILMRLLFCIVANIARRVKLQFPEVISNSLQFKITELFWSSYGNDLKPVASFYFVECISQLRRI